MQHLEHDMDDLFRKAADDYPLKSNENKWDSISSQVGDQSGAETGGQRTKGKRKKYIYSALLLLLFFFTGGSLLLKNIKPGKSFTENKNSLKNRPVEVIHTPTEKIIDPKVPIEFSKENNSSSLIISKKEPEVFFLTKTSQKKEQEEKNSDDITKNDDVRNNKWNILPAFSLKRELHGLHITQHTIKYRALPDVNSSPIEFNTTLPKNRGIYWGFTAGPQLNEVKSQGMNKTGFDIGLLVGYRFNKKVSLETGLLFATKYYYSDGKYFDMKPDPSMPPNMTLMSLKGNSNIIEIPVKVRYDFINDGKSNIFSSAGINSYLLARENNNYHTMVNGNPQDMDKSYKDVTNYTAATFYFSAGYEHRILKRNKIRIEPYLQIPLKGIGVGKMPVTSTGLHLGITWERK